MNAPMIRRLILKDWHFMRWPIALYLALGGVALTLIWAGSEASFYAGSVLLLTVLLSLGIHLVMATVVVERSEHTLPFVMSLPITPIDYTVAKIVANTAIFVLPWGALVAGALAVITGRDGIPDGLVPYATIVLTAILLGYCLILAVALISESQGWAIAAIVVGNLGLQAIMYTAARQPTIAASMKGDSVVWSSRAVAFLGSELALAAALIALTFYFQSRKTDFL